MTRPIVQQVLLTRFNIRTPGVGYTEDQSPQWLEERIELFAKYCVPSVAAQSEEDFGWLIFCDENTAPEDLDRIRSFDHRICIVLFASRVGPSRAKERSPKTSNPSHGNPGAEVVLSTSSMARYIRPEVGVVVSTRLDNDDALHCHALQRVRRLVGRFLETGHDRWLHNPMFGYRLAIKDERAFAVAMPNSPFLTLFERISKDVRPIGALSGHHSHMHERYPTFHDVSTRWWLQILHGGNVSNQIRPMDIEVPMASLGEDFNIPLPASSGTNQPRRLGAHQLNRIIRSLPNPVLPRRKLR